jgi:beta-lactamase superfamily II metal-dependent hydrolase
MIVAILLSSSFAVRADDVVVHIIDSGGAHCSVTEIPGGHYLVFDAGTALTEKDDVCADRIAEIVPKDDVIDLMILSHSDADHISAVPDLLAMRDVKQVVRTGYIRTTETCSCSSVLRSWSASRFRPAPARRLNGGRRRA